MAVRTCPTCLTVLSPSQVVAYSDNLECPGCKSRLTVWDGSRFLAAFGGILAGVLAWRLSSASFNAQGFLAWTLPVLYSFLAFGAVSSVFLMGTADLRLRADEPAPLPLTAEAGHSAQGGAVSHH
jgi:hypothetical protein